MKTKKPIQILRERHGGPSPELKERSRRQKGTERELKKALAAGPGTVPEIAAATGISTDEVFWLLMALKKYGRVVERDERDGYFEYALGTEEKQT